MAQKAFQSNAPRSEAEQHRSRYDQLGKPLIRITSRNGTTRSQIAVRLLSVRGVLNILQEFPCWLLSRSFGWTGPVHGNCSNRFEFVRAAALLSRETPGLRWTAVL